MDGGAGKKRRRRAAPTTARTKMIADLRQKRNKYESELRAVMRDLRSLGAIRPKKKA